MVGATDWQYVASWRNPRLTLQADDGDNPALGRGSGHVAHITLAAAV
jgi:hypothetical protein